MKGNRTTQFQEGLGVRCEGVDRRVEEGNLEKSDDYEMFGRRSTSIPQVLLIWGASGFNREGEPI